MNLAYTIDEINGTLKTQGILFSKLSYTRCHSTDDEATMRYVLPETRHSSELKTKTGNLS